MQPTQHTRWPELFEANNSLALVQKLVEDFRANKTACLSSDYQEFAVRQDVIPRYLTDRQIDAAVYQL